MTVRHHCHDDSHSLWTRWISGLIDSVPLHPLAFRVERAWNQEPITFSYLDTRKVPGFSGQLCIEYFHVFMPIKPSKNVCQHGAVLHAFLQYKKSAEKYSLTPLLQPSIFVDVSTYPNSRSSYPSWESGPNSERKNVSFFPKQGRMMVSWDQCRLKYMQDRLIHISLIMETNMMASWHPHHPCFAYIQK